MIALVSVWLGFGCSDPGQRERRVELADLTLREVLDASSVQLQVFGVEVQTPITDVDDIVAPHGLMKEELIKTLGLFRQDPAGVIVQSSAVELFLDSNHDVRVISVWPGLDGATIYGELMRPELMAAFTSGIDSSIDLSEALASVNAITPLYREVTYYFTDQGVGLFVTEKRADENEEWDRYLMSIYLFPPGEVDPFNEN